ncbi:HdeD family acid-resistance protein [Rhizocola hellebori]|uniref:HdeD family acid-resistance protein n=1 Tax=Rhizocola hellebori TaxID=1392758 RepID=UPI00194344DD|nr:DUF308 domain-containing protein [Rhizocola hellebori]
MTTLGVRSARATGLPWWLLLVTGALWIIVSWLVLGYNSRSVNAIAVLAGAVILAAGVGELYLMFFVPGWKWLHGLLGALFIVTGFFAWINPGKTVFWLAAFIGWYLLFKGAADIVLGFLTKATNEAWWLGVIIGIVEMLLGFWAAGRFERSLYLLIVYVAVIALARGITDIIMAFRVRKLAHEV